MGVRNICTYEEESYKVVINAPDADKACPKSIKWEEWFFTGTSATCSYDFPKFGEAIAYASDGVTVCFKHAYITFN